MELGKHAGGIDAAQGIDFGAGYRLAIGDERKRLQRRAGEARLAVELQERPHALREAGRGSELHGPVVAQDRPTPFRSVHRGDGVFDFRQRDSGRLGEIARLDRIGRDQEQRLD